MVHSLYAGTSFLSALILQPRKTIEINLFVTNEKTL